MKRRTRWGADGRRRGTRLGSGDTGIHHSPVSFTLVEAPVSPQRIEDVLLMRIASEGAAVAGMPGQSTTRHWTAWLARRVSESRCGLGLETHAGSTCLHLRRAHELRRRTRSCGRRARRRSPLLPASLATVRLAGHPRCADKSPQCRDGSRAASRVLSPQRRQ
jgi:hypothetical protein